MQRTARAVAGLVLACWGAALLYGQVELSAQQDDDLPHGGGTIRGVVTAAASGAPVPGAIVHALLATANASPVMSATDESGAFEFRGLTPGRWRVSASRSGFLPRESGQRGRTGQGSSIELKDRGVATANVALLRGGLIAGHVFDEFGEPAIGVRVQAMRFTRVENGRRLVPAGVPDVTDDTGAFRAYDLPPGDYVVSARARSPLEAAMNRVTRERAEQPSSGQSEPGVVQFRVAEWRGPRVSLATYLPGTEDVGSAVLITLDAGTERTSVDFSLRDNTPLRVSGTVVDSAGNVVSRPVLVSLQIDSLEAGTTLMLSSPVDASGTFDFGDVPPGSYTVTVSLAGPTGEPEAAEVSITVGADDITDLQIVTAPGVSLTGSVVFDNGTSRNTNGMRLAATSVNTRRLAASASTSGPVVEGAFRLPNLIGAYRLTLQGVPAGWSVKSIDVDGEDVTDSPITFKSGRPHATIVLTNRITDLSGTVTSGRKPIDADVLIFPDDPAKWTAWRYVRALRANEQGMFSIRGLPPHDRYLALATDYVEPDDVLSPEFLELVRSRATPFSLEEGQTRRVPLTLIDRSEFDGR